MAKLYLKMICSFGGTYILYVFCANGIVQVAKKPKRVVESILALITRHPAAFLVDKDATNVNDAIPLFTRYRHTKTLLYIS